jgi:hypothetical protein
MLTKDKTKKRDQLRLFILKPELLKIYVDLQTALARGTHLAGGATKHGEVTYFPGGTRIMTVSRAEGQNLVALKTYY